MSDLRKALCVGLAHLAYAAHGVDVFAKLKWLKETEKWTPPQRETWQLERLNDVLAFAWKNVPFYREFWSSHGCRWRPLGHTEELAAYPILRKEVFRENWEKIRPADVSAIPHIPKHTGGSTGRPVHYLLDKKQWALMQAFQIWGWSLTGYAFGDAVGVLTGGSLMPERITLFERTRMFIEHRLFLFGVNMDRKLARQYHGRLERFGAQFLYGYPSILYVFCRHLKEENLRLPKIRAVVTTAEMLLPHYREGIEDALGCLVFDDYGCNDGGFESFECNRHRGMHYNDFQSILSVEGEKSGPGTLLVTNLWNRSTPFIRYENGDRVTLAAGQCPCGSKFPMIESVEGRTADLLQFANGQTFVCPPHLFGNMQIDGWQVVQTTPSRVEVRLAKLGELDPNYLLRVEQVMRHHLNSAIEIEVKHVRQLSLTRAGKLKPVWSEVNSKPNAGQTVQ
jgi:phenylacetate-CoA ligase